MGLFRRAALAVLVGAVLSGSVMTAGANDRTVFAGCVKERTDKSITLDTSGGELITIDTTWLKPTMYDSLTADCLTVATVMVEGRYVAESVDVGDEPNEVNSFANESTSDRQNRSKQQEDDDKNGGKNDD
jgi:hypothetical protein